jgi:hypothetical protein
MCDRIYCIVKIHRLRVVIYGLFGGNKKKSSQDRFLQCLQLIINNPTFVIQNKDMMELDSSTSNGTGSGWYEAPIEFDLFCLAC